jgi:stress response protein YsnF
MTTIRQLIQTSPAKANELFAKLADTSESAVKTRERLFSELKGELELLSNLQEQHLFPVLRKHKETKDLVAEAISDNKQTRKLLTELERTPKESEEFASKVVELRKAFQQHVRDEKNELLPAVLKALSDEEAQAVVEAIEAEKAGIETAKRAEAEQRRAEARREREEAEELAEEQKQAARREKEARKAARQTAEAVAQTSEAVAESSREIVQSAAESAGRLVIAPLSSGSQFWDAMFGMWSVPQSRSGNARSSGVEQSSRAEEVIPLAEETLIVGKQLVNSGTTTVRRYVVESPVEQKVELYDEKVVVERRKPVTDAVTGEILTEVTVEMFETSEVPFVAKDVKVREEVVVRRERSRRVETVRDTVRRDEIEVEVERSDRAAKKRPALASSRK